MPLPADIKENSLYKFEVVPINTGGIDGEAHVMYRQIPFIGKHLLLGKNQRDSPMAKKNFFYFIYQK